MRSFINPNPHPILCPNSQIQRKAARSSSLALVDQSVLVADDALAAPAVARTSTAEAAVVPLPHSGSPLLCH